MVALIQVWALYPQHCACSYSFHSFYPTLSSNRYKPKTIKSNEVIKNDTQKKWEWQSYKFIWMLIYSIKWILPIATQRFSNELGLNYRSKKIQYYWTQCENTYILFTMNLPSRFSTEIDGLCNEWKTTSKHWTARQ